MKPEIKLFFFWVPQRLRPFSQTTLKKKLPHPPQDATELLGNSAIHTSQSLLNFEDIENVQTVPNFLPSHIFEILSLSHRCGPLFVLATQNDTNSQTGERFFFVSR